ncbi:MAG: AbrB/MazE/SpoVT family DNA-binding domain-containing protein [Gammaproteobacteria bacterium]|nr:AbrB/MazE/SpoVT family DNA-binding domain-containing protein [Gammaproteobacteria bacterium]
MHKADHIQDIKLVPIGNSLGVRLPKTLLRKYGLSGHLILEELEEGILIHSKKNKRVSWEQTYQAMAKAKEDWSDFDVTLAEGLEDL